MLIKISTIFGKTRKIRSLTNQKNVDLAWCFEHETAVYMTVDKHVVSKLTQQQMKIYSQHIYQKCYSHAATAIKYTSTTTVNTYNNWNAYYDTVLKFFTLLSYLQKSKQTKVFWCRSNILKSL